MALQTMHHPSQHQHHRSRPSSGIPPTSFHKHTPSDATTGRSSSETTAAGIFSMYEDPGSPVVKSPPPVPALDRLRYTQSSSRPASTSSRPSLEVEYRARSGSRPVSEMSAGDPYESSSRQRPGRSAEMGSKGPPVSYSSYGQGDSRKDRRSYTQDGRSSLAYDGTSEGRSSFTQPAPGSGSHTPSTSNQESTYPARRSSLQHLTDSLGTNGQPSTPSRAALKLLPPSRTPSPRIAMMPPSTSQVEQIGIVIPQSGGGGVSQHSIPSADLLTPTGDRERRTSSKHSMLTTQTTHTNQTSHTEYTTRGSTEDADAFRIRATYAKLEAEGVYGDGWMEGVERTRTRIMSAGSVALLEASKGAGAKGADVSKEEEARLRSTDRYGFFNTPAPRHEDRLALLPTIAFRQIPSTSKQPAIPTPPNAIPPLPSINHIPSPSTDPRENSRISKWERMLLPSTSAGSGGRGSTGSGGVGGGSGGGGWKWDTRKVRKRTERVFKGIPDRWRSAAWGMLAEERMVRPSERRTERVGLGELGRRYRDLLDQPSEHDVQIDLDVPRTISGHVMFHTRYGQGQRSLFHVLHAFSLLCPSCGYVQGMGPIAATLLNYFEPERCYAVLVRLHDEYAMHTIFQPGFPGLLESIYVQERLVERTMPGVYQALSKNMISSTSFVTKWYITLFANTVPFQTQLRLWDAFLLEGRDVLVVTAVAILWVLKDQISAAQANFETILSLLSSTFVIEDEDAMLHWMERLLADRKTREEMDGWRADWGRLVAEGKSGTALL